MDIPLEKKKFTTSRVLILVAIVLFLVFIVFVIIASSGPSKLNVKRERLTISKTTQGMFQEDIPVNGIVLPITTIYLDAVEGGDRKSTRLNSSHVKISYAVFCLNKKNNT